MDTEVYIEGESYSESTCANMTTGDEYISSYSIEGVEWQMSGVDTGSTNNGTNAWTVCSVMTHESEALTYETQSQACPMMDSALMTLIDAESPPVCYAVGDGSYLRYVVGTMSSKSQYGYVAPPTPAPTSIPAYSTTCSTGDYKVLIQSSDDDFDPTTTSEMGYFPTNVCLDSDSTTPVIYNCSDDMLTGYRYEYASGSGCASDSLIGSSAYSLPYSDSDEGFHTACSCVSSGVYMMAKSYNDSQCVTSEGTSNTYYLHGVERLSLIHI